MSEIVSDIEWKEGDEAILKKPTHRYNGRHIWLGYKIWGSTDSWTYSLRRGHEVAGIVRQKYLTRPVALPTLQDNVTRLQARQREMIEARGWTVRGGVVSGATEPAESVEPTPRFAVGQPVRVRSESTADVMYLLKSWGGGWWDLTTRPDGGLRASAHEDNLEAVGFLGGFPIGSFVVRKDYPRNKVWKVVGKPIDDSGWRQAIELVGKPAIIMQPKIDRLERYGFEVGVLVMAEGYPMPLEILSGPRPNISDPSVIVQDLMVPGKPFLTALAKVEDMTRYVPPEPPPVDLKPENLPDFSDIPFLLAVIEDLKTCPPEYLVNWRSKKGGRAFFRQAKLILEWAAENRPQES